MNGIIEYIKQSLDLSFSTTEREDIAFWLAEELTGRTRTQLLLDKGSDFSLDEKTFEYINRVNSGEPLPYILGHIEWRGLRLHVNPAVLIPRPETSEIVDWVLEDNNNTPCTVLDACTGSGCIAIALKKKRDKWKMTAVDISPSALEVANENAFANNAEINFRLLDVLHSPLPPSDILVSNPPYIMTSERETMQASVLEHEPPMALFVPDNDPLLFYRRIAAQHSSQKIYFEINPLCAESLIALLEEMNYTTTTREDYCGKTRMIRAEKIKV